MRLVVCLVMAAACSQGQPSSSERAAQPRAAAVPPGVAVPELVAKTLCDWYWRSSSTNARPYDSLEQCIAENTLSPGGCTEQQARACAAFAREATPGSAGLTSSPDCVACIEPVRSATFKKAYAEESAALARATLTVHSARPHTGTWPADVADRRTNAVLVVVDVELSGFGYRIDPDDFLLVTPGAAKGAAAVADSPYAERLTRDGKPVDWSDPSVVDDPDLRIRAFFPVAKAASAGPFAVEYNGKPSAPFSLR